MADAAEQKEHWSWGKFFAGFVDGRNYAKAIVLVFCMVVILVIVFSVGSVIKSRFSRPPAPTQTVGTNGGTINTTNDQSTVTVNHWHLPLSDLFNWFGSNKVQKEKTQ